MQRREILKGLAAASVLPRAPRAVSAHPRGGTGLIRRVRPPDPGWPEPAEWAPLNERRRSDYWGGNYPPLRSVKAHYGPDGLFFGHNGVGGEDWSRDGLTQLR